MNNFHVMFLEFRSSGRRPDTSNIVNSSAKDPFTEDGIYVLLHLFSSLPAILFLHFCSTSENKKS